MRFPLRGYVPASALFGALPFLFPALLWWLSFLFLIPLFGYVARAVPRNPWQEGWFWGILFFSLQSSWLFFLMWLKTDQAALGFSLALFFVMYHAFYIALWFVIATWLSRLCDHALFCVSVWAITGLATFYWLEHYALWVTGQWDGYPFMQPLLPLAVKPALLFCLPLLGTTGLLGALVVFSAAIALGIVRKQCLYFIIALFALLPFVIGALCWQPGGMQTWCANVGYLAPSMSHDPELQAQAIAQSLQQMRESYPAITAIVMPESMFGIALNDYPGFLSLWDDALQHKGVTMVLGAHSHEHNCWFNTLYVIRKGEIVSTHTKSHCIPFVEYLPFPWSRLTTLCALFLGNCYAFTPTLREQHAVSVLPSCTVIPYICSELYFSYDAPTSNPDDPLLCLVNDSWFIAYARHLLFLIARVKAMTWHRYLLYVGHYGAFCFTPAGNGQYLATLR